jgi:hypothetical protein
MAEMQIQITLTANESKRMIAKGIAKIHSVQKALQSGKIFLKGGSTVSAVCEELIGKPLRVSGRITPRGTVSGMDSSTSLHCALIQGGRLFDVGEILEETIANLDKNDVAIIGANVIDIHGNAAMMYGAALGDRPGRIVSGLFAEIKNILVPAGLEKLVPGTIREIILKTGRKSTDRSMGMAVGLAPIVGQIITEKEAIPLLAKVDCTVIGKGGILGAEGGTTMIIEGNRGAVTKVWDIISSIKGSGVSGIPESLRECAPPIPKCKFHRSCFYKRSEKPGSNKPK